MLFKVCCKWKIMTTYSCVTDIVEHGSEEDDNIATHIKDAALAGFLIGKLSLARNRTLL